MPGPENGANILPTGETPAEVPARAVLLTVLATLCVLILLYELITWQSATSSAATGLPAMARAL
ncbi:MAG: hypothetical protein M3Y56_03865 [Armatimonadota bacterium]|nr:hypothetical protein [Armatimonadota bacterium]